MSKATVGGNAQAMPIDRRSAFRSVAAAGALLLAPRVAKAAETDAEIIALSEEIVRRANDAVRFCNKHIKPFEERFHELILDPSKPSKARCEEAFAFSRASGREAAIVVHNEMEENTDRLFKRLMAIPAKMQSGRAAKVRALLVHVMRDEWRGPASELDWDREMARALLGEFAGVSATDLETI